MCVTPALDGEYNTPPVSQVKVNRVSKLSAPPNLPIFLEQGPTSQQNHAQKLYSRLHWAYQKAQENNKKESECHKKYYDQRMRCMK